MSENNTFNNLDFVFNKNEGVEEQISIKTSTTGLELNYDTNTANPKTFSIRPSGVRFQDNTTNNTTTLDRLASVQQAFQAITLPPNSTTLEINNTLTLDDQSGNTASIGLVGADMNINTSGDTTFTKLPLCSVVPTTATQLVNKSYVDNTVSTNASTINITETDTNATFYPTFCNASGNTITLRADTTTPFSYNPNTGTLTASTFSGSLVGNPNGNLAIIVNSTGDGGTLSLTGGTGLVSATSSGNSGQHLAITINGTPYKIALLNP